MTNSTHFYGQLFDLLRQYSRPQDLRHLKTLAWMTSALIVSLYARGMTVRDIQAQLQDLYGVEVSAGLISNVTDAVEEERKLWQNRTLDSVYPIVYFDALVVKVRQDGRVINKAVHLALGVNLAGTKELLGLWITPNESAKFWLSVLTELQNRGVKDILIACVDGLTGFPDAIEAVFPKTTVQLCIVHLVRNSLSYVSYKDRKAVAADLRLIYTAATEAEAEQRLVEFAETWDKQSPTRPQVLDDPLESHHSLLCLPRRNSQSHLHHQHD
nr:IS256 family transposase [Leptolyngbya ohadii]